jgi:hypothetical protein
MDCAMICCHSPLSVLSLCFFHIDSVLLRKELARKHFTISFTPSVPWWSDLGRKGCSFSNAYNLLRIGGLLCPRLLIYTYYSYYWIENTLKFLKLFELCM